MTKKIEIKDKENNIYYKDNPEYFDELYDLYLKSGSHFYNLIKSIKYKHIFDWITGGLPLLVDKFFNLRTKVFWIFNNITEFPKCANPDCKRNFSDRNILDLNKGYTRFCTHKCAVNSDEIKQKSIDTCLRKYGTTSPGQNDKVKAKSKKTCLAKYGVAYSFQSENNKNKSKQTCKQRYGVELYSKSKYYSKLWRDPKFRDTAAAKSIATKIKNSSFNKSKPEDIVYTSLIEKFGENNIIRQYKDSRYTFNCDFYIKQLDLFIECNFHWTHGFHYFNKESIQDMEKYNKWKARSNSKKFYKQAIYVWTNLDLRKKQMAIDNKLNYIVFWNLQTASDWISKQI